ncbi:MAG: hypothetical protein N3A38_03475 [Planctomycetota bacterium]|nr:hypothetical protein [Planctomycetota bacterium]
MEIERLCAARMTGVMRQRAPESMPAPKAAVAAAAMVLALATVPPVRGEQGVPKAGGEGAAAGEAGKENKRSEPKDLSRQLNVLLMRLNGPDEHSRREAHSLLVELGGPAVTALEAQARSLDAEKAARARAVLDEIRRKAEELMNEAIRAEHANTLKPITVKDVESVRDKYRRLVEYAPPGMTRQAAIQRAQAAERDIEEIKRGESRMKIIEERLAKDLEPEMRAYYLKSKAEILLKVNRFREAFEAADGVLTKSPGSKWTSFALLMKAKSAAGLKDRKTFEECARTIIEKYPYGGEGPAAYELLLDYAEFRNDAVGALELARRFYRTYPASEEALNKRLDVLDWLMEDRGEYGLCAEECDALLAEVPLARLRFDVPYIAAKCYEYALEDFEKAEQRYRMVLDRFPESAQGDGGDPARRGVKRAREKREKKARGEPIVPAIPEAERTKTPHNTFWTFVRAVRTRDEALIRECVVPSERDLMCERAKEPSDPLRAEYTFADFKPSRDAREHQGQVLLWIKVETPDDPEPDDFLARFVKDGDRFLLTFARPERPARGGKTPAETGGREGSDAPEGTPAGAAGETPRRTGVRRSAEQTPPGSGGKSPEGSDAGKKPGKGE